MSRFTDSCRAQVAGKRAMAVTAAETEEIFEALLGNLTEQPSNLWWFHRDPRFFKDSEGHNKYWCLACDSVTKRSRTCCGQPMVNMGDIWKPGPKGNRMKHYPEGWGTPIAVRQHWPNWRSGEKLRRRGRIISRMIS